MIMIFTRELAAEDKGCVTFFSRAGCTDEGALLQGNMLVYTKKRCENGNSAG
jgi:hypothetical protein